VGAGARKQLEGRWWSLAPASSDRGRLERNERGYKTTRTISASLDSSGEL